MTRPRTRPSCSAALADPGIRAALVLLGIVLAGFTGIALAWRGVAATLYVSIQFPFLVSAGLGGAALVAAGLALLTTHLQRREAAARRVEIDTIVRTTGLLAEALRRRHTTSRATPGRVRLGSTLHEATCRLVAARDDATAVTGAQAVAAELRSCRVCQPGKPTPVG
ncbi:MAG TPA: hypothetical protein VNG13_13565 [Mycobacteriales bacterium]|nr:hypothetical protein [Mycobacteriales bacterium]